MKLGVRARTVSVQVDEEERMVRVWVEVLITWAAPLDELYSVVAKGIRPYISP